MDPQYRSKFARPERILSEIFRTGAKDLFLKRSESVSFVRRALVVAVDVEGGNLENPGGSGKLTQTVDGRAVDFPATVGPKNPANSIRARIITDGFDQFIHDDHLRTFWPLFPEHLMLPIKPGEHAYVMFEDPKFEHGLWISKVSGHEDINFFKGSDSFDTDQNTLVSKFSDSAAIDSSSKDEDLNTDVAAAQVNPDGRLTNLSW